MTVASSDQLFGARRTDHHLFEWDPPAAVTTPSRSVVGGAVIGAAINAMEAVTDRPLIYAAAQFISMASDQERLTFAPIVITAARTSTQARCLVTSGGREILSVQASMGERRAARDEQWSAMPSVPGPDLCDDYEYFEFLQVNVDDQLDCTSLYEIRVAHGRPLTALTENPARGDGRLLVWVRCGDRRRRRYDAATLAFVADLAPLALADATGLPAGGVSLDNSLRVGTLHDSEWILLDIEVQQISQGFAHVRADLWSDDGVLMASASQTCVPRTQRL